MYLRLAAAVLLSLSGAGSAAHSNVLYGSAETCKLVPLEVGQGYEYVRIHYCAAYLGVLDIFAALDGDFYVVSAFETVRYDYGTSGAQGSETVLPGAVQMLQGVFPEPGIHCVAVCQERLSSKFLYNVNHRLCKVGPEETDIAQFSKVHLYCHEPSVHINVAYSGLLDEFLELGWQSVSA